jgi:hypothetical protein
MCGVLLDELLRPGSLPSLEILELIGLLISALLFFKRIFVQVLYERNECMYQK